MFTLHSFSFSTFEVCQHEKGISLFLLWWSYHQEHGHHFYHPNSLSVTIKLLPVLFLYPWHRFSNQCEVLKSLIFYLTFCKRGNETGSQASYWENPYGWSCCLSSWSFSLSQRFYSYVRYADRCSFVQKKKSFPFDNWTKMTISKMWCLVRSKGIAPLLFCQDQKQEAITVAEALHVRLPHVDSMSTIGRASQFHTWYNLSHSGTSFQQSNQTSSKDRQGIGCGFLSSSSRV
jgi:hypothetical protein